MIHKMIKKFDSTDDNVKEMRNDLTGVSQKVEAHVVLIKQIEQQLG